MGSTKTTAFRLGGLMLAGGLLTGGLLAMTTPTQMKREANNWREAIGAREPAVGDSTIPIYAPPEDLTPVQWQSASQEYPYAPTSAPWVDTMTDLMPDAADDTDLPLAAEALPDEIMVARGSRGHLPPQNDAPQDDAAVSADAARATAADVQSVESAAAVADTGLSVSSVPASAT